ncbi:2-dehydro-3-deoxy-6-phosphogalactonate aldolase [Ralstonia mannitolilytica]|uniref:2-dehydro-3-deoxy-6-phosphogalactonate aldolase n=1 Tax=Ralstonia mannitolilytica TaxID=105219 RepID=A0AAJ4ZN77_9RALS|nr:2-dehydro-3-deoxy-6-phosphogalactonate aldolase [Ralstonia mannitolilytica]AJW44426.1 2-dehydro-3-deoxy-6-phosphogalactonate aldolase [Ralstonia mannitolilytica]MBU9577684.1 2-dehydro-3-deoxy-6-phosphogalactonate aldolase [Ralstonia mannitolilytica]CAG2147986.1 2-dehydro-3-deoxy-6-phosphogalactonate aldolase [Ralstonia mannitolilytica]CAJ0726484.1 2-dehydro-3-deoxy-6-phosphogalactonate aldolase [Ralstonia mannitolilytica]CAJ0777847.1 2-dehydro-3-deoxy-6-phosphogalactonate aldolase [Ralstoni
MTWTTHLPLIAILRGIRPDEVLAHTQALVDAGFDAIEIPLNSPDWAQSVQLAARAFGDRALIGAGTVLRAEDVDLMVAAGGKLVVTPNTHTPVIRAAVHAGLVTCIGCMTATEAFAALDAGAQALKIFPAGNLGTGYVRALKAVLPADVPVFAVGGITPENLADYLAAGCIGAGLGSDLYRPGQPAERTAERARAFVAAYRAVQSVRT